MKQIYEDLWQSKLEIPFGSVHAHAYLLKCPNENVLIYSTGHSEELESIAELGGIRYQLLSHRDEAGETLKAFKQRFSSQLCCHELEIDAITLSCPVDIVFTDNTHQLAGIKIIHTPGHTAGSVSFVYDSPFGKRYLFTGDTFFQTNGQWQTIFFPSAGGSLEDLQNSLLVYRDLKPDVVLWSASGGGEDFFTEVTDSQWRSIIDTKLKELEGT